MNDLTKAFRYAAAFLRELAATRALPLDGRAAASESGPAGGRPHGGSHLTVDGSGPAVGESSQK